MKRSLVVGISGGSCAGKSYLAERIIQYLNLADALLLSQDAYYKDLSGLSGEEMSRHNFDHPHSFDIGLMLSQIRSLLDGETVFQPIYDYTRHLRTDRVREIQPAPIILIEGILIFHYPELRDMMDLKIFVDVSEDIRLSRRLQRDTALRGRSDRSVMEQYERSVKPMHERFVEPTRYFADIVVNEGWEKSDLLDTLRAKMAWFLHHYRHHLAEGFDLRGGSAWREG